MGRPVVVVDEDCDVPVDAPGAVGELHAARVHVVTINPAMIPRRGVTAGMVMRALAQPRNVARESFTPESSCCATIPHAWGGRARAAGHEDGGGVGDGGTV